MKTLALFALLIAAPVSAQYLATPVEEGSDFDLTMTLLDKHKLPLTPQEVGYLAQVKRHGADDVTVYTGTPITNATSNVVQLNLPPAANAVLNDGLPVERRVVVVRVKAGGRWRNFFPEYDVTNKKGFSVVGGQLVQNTPTP